MLSNETVSDKIKHTSSDGYKQTDVGTIPEEWGVRKLPDICWFQEGPGLRSWQFNGSGMKVINVTNLENGILNLDRTDRYIRIEEFTRMYRHFAIDAADIVMASSGNSYSKTAIVRAQDLPLVMNTSVIRFKPLKGCDYGFLWILLNSPGFKKQIDLMITGGAQPNFGPYHLKRINIPFPDCEEQRVIATVLRDTDALINSLEKLISKKRDLKQAAMQQLLTGQTRLPGFHREWEIKRLGDLFSFSGGYSASRDQLSTEGHCYLHYGDIHGSSKSFIDTDTDFQNIPKLDIPLKRVSSASLLDDGDVVFVDASEDDAGTSKHVVIVNKGKKPFISGLHTIVAKSKTDELSHEFRRYCFQTSAIRQQFLFYSVGTKVSGISKGNIPKLMLTFPSVPEQTAIAEVLSDMDAEIMALEQRLEKARDLKQGMMQQLLTGKIRLVSSTTQERPATVKKQSHNWEINEAVIIGVMAKLFGTPAWPLPRKRCTKLTYLLHRHVERKAEGYLKKAAGPYNPATRYKGPERIAQKNGYIDIHHNGKYEGFIAGNKIAQAETYFDKWYGSEVLSWLERFRFYKTDELEVLATVDMALEDVFGAQGAISLENVKKVILEHPEWKAKLSRPCFSDDGIRKAMHECESLFQHQGKAV